MPARADFDPVDVPQILPNITITDVFYDPLRFRYRLIGTAITELTGRDATGKWLDRELYGDNLDRMLWTFQSCVEGREPVAVRQQAQFPNRDWVTVEVLLMPLGDRDDRVSQIISCLIALDEGGVIPPMGTSHILDWTKDPTDI
jgi:hypothetical protein